MILKVKCDDCDKVIEGDEIWWDYLDERHVCRKCWCKSQIDFIQHDVESAQDMIDLYMKERDEALATISELRKQMEENGVGRG